MNVKVSDLVWTYNHCYKQRCFYNPFPHGSATWTGNGPTGTRNCGSYPWSSGRGGYNYRHELITCSPNFEWCKLLKTVCEWNHEEGRLVKRTSPSFHCDADWAALSNAGYIIYDEAAHTWYSTEQGRALNNLIKEAFADQAARAELERAEQEAKEKLEKNLKETASLPLGVPCGAPEGSVANPISNGGVVENQKKSNTKVKTFTHIISQKSQLEKMDAEINEFIGKVSVKKILVNTCYHGDFGSIVTHTIVYND